MLIPRLVGRRAPVDRREPCLGETSFTVKVLDYPPRLSELPPQPLVLADRPGPQHRRNPRAQGAAETDENADSDGRHASVCGILRLMCASILTLTRGLTPQGRDSLVMGPPACHAPPMIHWRQKLFGLLVALLWACGGDAITVSEPLEIETAEEELISDNNFGIVAGTLRQCNAGTTGQCWYPPGFGSAGTNTYKWRVCPQQAGITQAQAQMATAAQLNVMQTLRNGGVDINFDCQGGTGLTSEIRVFKGPSPGLSCGTACAANNIRRYVSLFCTVSQPLSESPSISGSHSYCYRYNAEVDYNAIDAAFPNATDRAHAYEHATGVILAGASLGTGLHSVASLNNYWTFDGQPALPKNDVHPADYCRADADYDGIDFFVIRKLDNACD